MITLKWWKRKVLSKIKTTGLCEPWLQYAVHICSYCCMSPVDSFQLPSEGILGNNARERIDLRSPVEDKNRVGHSDLVN